MHIINHRICRKHENKVCQLKKMIEKGYSKFEIDVIMCKDDLVIFHDTSIKLRNTSKNIIDCCYTDLKKLGIDNIDDLISELSIYRSQYFQQPLDIYLDIKGNSNETITRLLNKIKVLDSANTSRSTTTYRDSYVLLLTNINIYLQTFNYNFILELRKYMPYNKYKIGLILAGYLPYIPPNIDYLVVENTYFALYEQYANFSHKLHSKTQRLPIYLYTINSKDEIRYITDEKKKITGIFTDYPERF